MTIVRFFAVLGTVFLIGLAFYLLEGMLTPFIIAWVLAYLLVPVVDFLHRRMPRWVAIMIVFVVLATIGSVLLRWLLPQMQQEMVLFMHQLPATMGDLAGLIQATAHALHVRIASQQLTADIEAYLFSIGSSLVQGPSIFFTTAAQAIKVAVFICLIPIVTFYLLRDWHDFTARIESMAKGGLQLRIHRLLQTSNEVFRRFIHGQILAMVGFGVMYTVGYSLSGISLGLVLGTLAGLASAIPFAAFVLTGLPALLLATVQFHDFSHVLFVMLTIAGSELIGNLVLIPVLVGRYVKVHAAAVLFLIFAGGALFGVLGMLMALPLAAILAAYETQYGILQRRDPVKSVVDNTEPENKRTSTTPSSKDG